MKRFSVMAVVTVAALVSTTAWAGGPYHGPYPGGWYRGGYYGGYYGPRVGVVIGGPVWGPWFRAYPVVTDGH